MFSSILSQFSLVLIKCIIRQPNQLHAVLIGERSLKVSAVFDNKRLDGFAFFRFVSCAFDGSDLLTVQTGGFDSFASSLPKVVDFLFGLLECLVNVLLHLFIINLFTAFMMALTSSSAESSPDEND